MDTELLSKKFGQMGARVKVDCGERDGGVAATPAKPLITRRVKRLKDRLRRKNKAFARATLSSSTSSQTSRAVTRTPRSQPHNRS